MLLLIKHTTWLVFPTVVGLLHPREGDPAQMAFAEAQQEGPPLLALEQGSLLLLAHEAHDVTAQRFTLL